MANLRRAVGASAQRQALVNALERIRTAAQVGFQNPVEVVYYEPDESDPVANYALPGAKRPLFCLVEVHKRRVLGFIPAKPRYRNLVVARPDNISTNGKGKKVAECIVHDKTLMAVARKEMKKYADAFKATAKVKLQSAS